MYLYVDQTDQAPLDEYRDMSVESIDFIVLHRSGPWVGEPPTGAASLHLKHRQYVPTLPRCPYHFVVNPKLGAVYQWLPLSKQGQHALSYNKRSIAVAVLGGFADGQQLTVPEFAILHALLGDLECRIEQLTEKWPMLIGHDSVPGGSADPNKVCPGPGLFLDSLVGLASHELGDIPTFAGSI